MTTFLSWAGSPLVDAIVRDRTLVVFDYDGVLAPGGRDPRRAEMPQVTRALLRVVALLNPCAVISGRARADLMSRVQGLPFVAVMGCHGADPGHGPRDPELLACVADWRPRLERALRGRPGLEVEDRGLGIALHHRRGRQPPRGERAALTIARSLPGAVAFVAGGVVNAVPRAAPPRSDAISALCARLRVKRAVYVGEPGDDGRGTEARSPVISIGVGAPRPSPAGRRVDGPTELEDLLRALITARTRQDGRGDRVDGLVRAVGG